jgi:gamma-glutamyltranspeptidase/glutathione hydrolase
MPALPPVHPPARRRPRPARLGLSSLPFGLLPLGLLAIGLVAAAPPSERARGGMVAADERQCSAAGAELLSAGGNAVDAAIAAALACGVTQPSSSGLGGGGFAVVLPSAGDPLVLDFREVAPAAATRDMFLRAEDPKASTRGGLAVAVPSEGIGLATLHRRAGKLPLTRVAAPAIRLAREGFSVGWHLARSLTTLSASEAEGPSLLRALLGVPAVRQGDLVRRPALARSLERFARTGGEDNRTGETAKALVAADRAAGGILTEADLAAYTPKERPPLVGRYRGWTVVSMPPPSSGGAVLLQILAVLEGYDLRAMGAGSSELLHLQAEAMKHAYADRARLMGDPDRVAVPVSELLSPARILAVQRAIIPGRTFPPERYGSGVALPDDHGTQHISVIDGEGLAVALTTTVNTSFGSKVIDEKSGIVLNNEMDDFVARPGVPNAFGLVGSEANSVAAGARPLSSMSPTVLVSPDGQRRIAVGASGGPFIISSTLQAIVHVIDFGMDPSAAVSAPRIHHQWTPDTLTVDTGFSADTLQNLRARGHKIQEMPFFSAVELVSWTKGEGTEGASDPRKGGWPAGSLR